MSSGYRAAAVVLNRISARVGVTISGGNVGASLLGSYLMDKVAA